MTLPDSNIPQKLNSLRKSKFRSRFKLSQKDRDYIATKGLETIKEHAFQFINSRVAPDFPKNDGKQTPMRGHPVFIAQHATATCCRGVFRSGMESRRIECDDKNKIDTGAERFPLENHRVNGNRQRSF